jgi:hypothetical protein
VPKKIFFTQTPEIQAIAEILVGEERWGSQEKRAYDQMVVGIPPDSEKVSGQYRWSRLIKAAVGSGAVVTPPVAGPIGGAVRSNATGP